MIYELDSTRVLLLSIVVLWVGSTLTQKVALLRRFSIPVAVTGGLLCSILVAVLETWRDVDVQFDLALRDTMLLAFFGTIGLSAKMSLLKEGGRVLAILMGVTVLFLVAQNVVGMAASVALGHEPGYGLIGGSISLAGGHGTAITWGTMAEEAGYEGVTELGLAFATFGLVLGGLVGGPVASFLLQRYRLVETAKSGEAAEGAPAAGERNEPVDVALSVTPRQMIRTIFLLAVCMAIGGELNRYLSDKGTVLPGFLTAMGVGIVLTNLMDLRRRKLDTNAIELVNQISLALFLAMSLMSMQLTQLAGSLGAILVVLTLQVVLAFVFAVFVVFRFCGRDYDAAVIASGFAGLGLGATPVGVANMGAVTGRFGPSPKAFLIVPLVGAFFLDIANAFVIQTALGLPAIREALGG